MHTQETREGSPFTGALETFSRFRGAPGTAGDAPGGGAVSVIATGLRVVGDITGSGEVRIEGEVEGSVSSEASVLVGPGGRVEGRVEAEEVEVAGRLSGVIEARRRVRLRQGCRVDADIRTPAMELEDGGVVNGRLEMGGGDGGRGASRQAGGKNNSREGAGKGGSGQDGAA